MTSVTQDFSGKTKMAKLCVVCGSLCVYFLIFFTSSAVLSIEDKHYYNYEIDEPSTDEYHILQKYQIEHHLRRRDVETNQSYSSTRLNGTALPTLPPKPNDTVQAQNKSEILGNGVPMVNKTTADSKVSATKAKLGKKVEPITLNSGPLGVQRNLGENGTGQRKNVTFPTPVVELNVTTSTPSVNVTINADNDSEEKITINSFPTDEDSKEFNKTLTDHNITTTKEDSHQYYNSTLRTDPEAARYFWVDLENRSDTKINELLSRAHRRAATVQLSFEFPFYGHLIKNVTIATGGFLYTGDYVHSWLAATQYIAPLMANFDTSISNDSLIRYTDNGTAFTVEWVRVVLRDKPNVGEFTFQTTLHKSGDIVFVYENMPMFIESIEDDQHPVKVGLSDAYIIDRTIFLVRRKTIYEYHRVNFCKEDIKNGTVIYLKALPTCLQHEDCVSCTTNILASFKCRWCPSINRCSNGFDRHRQHWLTKGCDDKYVDEEKMCSQISDPDIFADSNVTYSHDSNEFQQLQGYSKPASRGYNNPSALGTNNPVRMGVSSIVAILFLIAMVCGLAVWVLYAYRNPHTTSGQILIRYRPSQWRWRRGEARYTAATIHM